MEKIKLLVVDDIPQTRKDITRLLYFEDDMIVVGEAADGVEALKKINELQPDVVLMDINMPQMDGITATERVCHMFPHVAVVIISIQGESEYLKKAMVAGARDYLVKPLGSEEMATTIRNAYKQQRLRMPNPSQARNNYDRPIANQVERAQEPPAPLQQQYNNQPGLERTEAFNHQASHDHANYGQDRFTTQSETRERQISQQDYLHAAGNSTQNNLVPKEHHSQHMLQADPQPERFWAPKPEMPAETPAVKETNMQTMPPGNQRLQPAQMEEKPLGQVIVVFCGKGGVGKTTIATNLAVVLAQQDKKKVALVDYDLQFGDISVLLNLADGKNISDLVQSSDTFTDELLNNYLIRHFTGIDILPAPLFPQDAEYITADHTDRVLHLLKNHYDYIVVDTAATFNEINLQSFDLADQILLVTTRDIVTIKNTKTSLNILESLNYREKIRVVLNRSDQDLGVEISDLEKGLEITVAHQVTSDEKAVISAINKGVPVVVSHSGSEIARSFRRLSERMVNGRRHSAGEKQSRSSLITRMFSL